MSSEAAKNQRPPCVVIVVDACPPARPPSLLEPQGGIEGSEFATDAAARELHKETGLVVGRDVVLEMTTTTAAADDDGVVKCRYETGGTGGWLEGEGYAGQESHWVVFRCASSLLETDPYVACTLSGMDDVGPEFSAVRWMMPDLAVQAVPGRKTPPYRMLAERRIPPIAT